MGANLPNLPPGVTVRESHINGSGKAKFEIEDNLSYKFALLGEAMDEATQKGCQSAAFVVQLETKKAYESYFSTSHAKSVYKNGFNRGGKQKYRINHGRKRKRIYSDKIWDAVRVSGPKVYRKAGNNKKRIPFAKVSVLGDGTQKYSGGYRLRFFEMGTTYRMRKNPKTKKGDNVGEIKKVGLFKQVIATKADGMMQALRNRVEKEMAISIEKINKK